MWPNVIDIAKRFNVNFLKLIFKQVIQGLNTLDPLYLLNPLLRFD